jgi:selenocysteine-specific elongation factor
VEFLVGTSERRARVAPIGGRLEPGTQGFARVHIEGDPVPVLPGERFVLRGFARTEMGGATLGGGRVLDVAPPHRRRSDPALREELVQLARGDASVDVEVRVARAGLAGVARADLERETGLDAAALDAAQARNSDRVVAAGTGHFVAASALEALEARLLETLAAYHAAEPLRPGMPTGALRGALPENVPDVARDAALARLAERGQIVVTGDHVALSDHRVELDAETQALTDRLAARLVETGLDAPNLRDLAEHVGRAPEALGDLLAHLERRGTIVRAPGDLWFDAGAVAALRDRVRAHFEAHDALDTKTFKDLIGTTRRTAVPLMELLDTEQFTARRGEVRVLRDRG